MRKIILTAILICIVSVAAQAQTEKGNVMIGGGLQFQTSEGTSLFTADPNIGFFLANNFAAGAQITLISTSGNTVWGIGPYARYYFKGQPKGKFFAQAGVSFAGASGGGTSSSTSTAFQAKLGYAVFLNKNVALELATNLMTGEGTSVFGLGAGFQIHLK